MGSIENSPKGSFFESLDAAALVTHARKLSGLTQQQLALRSGTSQSAIARYETGAASPSVDTLTRVLKANGVRLEVSIVPAHLSNLASPKAKALRENRGKILRMIRQAGGSNVRIFGSVARGDDDEQSDIDLLIDFDVNQGILPIVGLNRELSALLDSKVEVSPIQLLKKEILTRALSDAVPL